MEVDLTQLTRMLRRSPDGRAKTDQDDKFDVESQFHASFGKLFQRVPGSDEYFFYSPQESSETDVDDVDPNDAVDDPSEQVIRDPEDEVDDLEGDDGWQADPGRAPLKATSAASQTAVFDFPFFLRLECGLYTSSGPEPERGSRMIAPVRPMFCLS
jgi:hypothetical protein